MKHTRRQVVWIQKASHSPQLITNNTQSFSSTSNEVPNTTCPPNCTQHGPIRSSVNGLKRKRRESLLGPDPKLSSPRHILRISTHKLGVWDFRISCVSWAINIYIENRKYNICCLYESFMAFLTFLVTCSTAGIKFQSFLQAN